MALSAKKRRLKYGTGEIDYAKLRSRLQSVYQFNFRNTKYFTPAQKGLITKLWYGARNDDGTLKRKNPRIPEVRDDGTIKDPWDYPAIQEGLKSDVLKVESGEATFVRANKNQTKELKRSQRVTNKGVIIHEKVDTVKITGKGKSTKIHIVRGQRKELFIPFPKGAFDVEVFLNDLIKRYKPLNIRVGVMDYRGGFAYTPNRAVRYITDILDDYKRRGRESPLSGVYLIWRV